jgi:hypothetical protein
MSTTKSTNRRYVIAATAMVAVALGAYGLGHLVPPLGPTMGTIFPQRYVDSITAGQIPERGRVVLVDAASARLFMIEDGRVRDTMRVIVGKPEAATPALRSMISYATLNPYWNVPEDLAQTLIAPRVLKDGTAYLTDRGYEIVSGARVRKLELPLTLQGASVLHRGLSSSSGPPPERTDRQ